MNTDLKTFAQLLPGNYKVLEQTDLSTGEICFRVTTLEGEIIAERCMTVQQRSNELLVELILTDLLRQMRNN